MDDLECQIVVLKKSLAATWSRLANLHLSQFEKRELRNQARHHSEELRRCLLIVEAKQARQHLRALVGDAARAPPKPELRLLTW